MIERLARRPGARNQFRFAAEAKALFEAREDVLLAKSHRGLHLVANAEPCLRPLVRALESSYGAHLVIEPQSRAVPVVEVRIGLERSHLAAVRVALARRGLNPSEEYEGTHYCVLRFEAASSDLLGMPVELAELAGGRFSEQMVVTGYR